MKLFHFLCVAFFITGCATAYPQNWWKEVPAGEAKSWEILPQAAKQGEVILSKRTELDSTSNSGKIRAKSRGKNIIAKNRKP